MKYFTKELWMLMNSGDARKSQAAAAQWQENLRCYEAYLSTIKNKKATAFLKSLDQHKGLHDYDVEYIKYDVQRSVCEIGLDYCGKCRLRFAGVRELRADMGELNKSFPKLRWGYHEIELLDDGTWRFSMLFDWENELEITAKSAALDCDIHK